MELTALQELIHQMYIAYYQRPADPEGLAYWVDQIEQNGSWEAVSAAFGAPENTEYQALYGDKTRAELVAELYQSAFNRAAVQDEIDFWVASEHTDLNLAFAIINGAQNDDLATVNNKVAFSAELASQLATNDAYLGLNDPKALLNDITKDSTVDSDSVAAAIEADTAEPAFTLTKGLEDLQDAQAGLAAALKAVAEADLTDATEADDEAVIEDNPATENVDELQVAIDAYTAEMAEAEVAAAAQAVADAEAGVLTAEADLTTARATKFTDPDVLTLDGVTANTYMTDANVAAAVTEAQAEVDAAKSLYLEDGTIVADEDGVAQEGFQKVYLANNNLTTNADAEGAVFKGYDAIDAVQDPPVQEVLELVETVTAADLQELAAGATADLEADIASNGTYTELLADLRSAINAYVAAEGAETLTNDGNTLLTVRGDIAAILDDEEQTAAQIEASAKAYVLAYQDGAADSIALADETDPVVATAEEKAVNDALEAFFNREELVDADIAATAAFVGTDTGTVLAAAEALQEARDTLVENIATAQEDLADAQAYNETLTALIEAHTAAAAEVEAAEQVLADNGVDSVITLSENSNGTLFGADVFLYSPETAAATIGRFEADDQLFLGDFAVVMLGEGEALATDRLGDAAVLEVFVGENADGDAVFSFETQAFAGNAESVADIETITITGVAVADLAIADGFVSLV